MFISQLDQRYVFHSEFQVVPPNSVAEEHQLPAIDKFLPELRKSFLEWRFAANPNGLKTITICDSTKESITAVMITFKNF